MCFMIDKSAPAPKQKYGYKVVRKLADGRLRSWHGGRWTQPYWEPGKVVRRSKGPTEFSGYDGSSSKPVFTAEHGIYVYLTKAGAVHFVRLHSHKRPVIIRVAVDPADFLYRGMLHHDKPVATYSKATMVKKVRP